MKRMQTENEECRSPHSIYVLFNIPSTVSPYSIHIPSAFFPYSLERMRNEFEECEGNVEERGRLEEGTCGEMWEKNYERYLAGMWTKRGKKVDKMWRECVEQERMWNECRANAEGV